MNIKEFKKQPILGILRGIELNDIEPLFETIISSGLKTVEITMNSPNAKELIQKAVKSFGKKLVIGAGTVLDLKSLKNALNSGASFIVMPVLIEEVMEYCAKNKIPVFPGALTPDEIYKAWNCGATMVKVFPSKFFGPDYFKEIKGPFNDIELLACGGITPENIRTYFSNGASAVAIGSSVFKKEWIESKKFSSIEQTIKNYLLKLN